MVYEVLRAGHYKIAHEIIKDLVKHQNWGFNQLHCDVLGKNLDLGKVLKVSTQKKCNTNKDVTPMHAAAVNPNEKFIE
jgi:hypothetical protein